MKKERKTWFITRSRGTGWLPNSWQGWLVVFIWLLIVTGVISWLNLVFDNVWLAMSFSIVWCSFMLGALSVIAKLKSNQPEKMSASGKARE